MRARKFQWALLVENLTYLLTSCEALPLGCSACDDMFGDACVFQVWDLSAPPMANPVSNRQEHAHEVYVLTLANYSAVDRPSRSTIYCYECLFILCQNRLIFCYYFRACFSAIKLKEIPSLLIVGDIDACNCENYSLTALISLSWSGAGRRWTGTWSGKTPFWVVPGTTQFG